ncbi:MAG: cobalamin biosynthesis bifunctional protein CbiET [Pseudomonadales bacterium]|nr:cobalamin biosynthesis bifunctional protein CbiET [Pseudomonadales bacterium]
MNAAAIHIVGLGVSEKAELSSMAQAAIENAEVVIGSERQLATLGFNENPCSYVLPKLAQLKLDLAEMLSAGKNVALLATGDPLFYGIGGWLTKRFSDAVLTFYPAVSSIQAACHRIGISLQDTDVVSLHGRPLSSIRRHLEPGATLVILTDHKSNPVALANECKAAKFADSDIIVCETLGYKTEKVTCFNVEKLLTMDAQQFDPLHLSIVKVKGAGGVLPVFPGFLDTLFVTGAAPGKGMISKREVRLQILSYMQPNHGDLIWDIGAGCGGVAVELAYWGQRSTVYAIEFHQERLQHLATNREKFGVTSNLHIIKGRAPDCLVELPKPNKVFIGGSDGELEQLLEQAWNLLPENGCLVASAVIEQTKNQLKRFAETLAAHQVESVELAVKRGELVEAALQYQTKLPVEIFKFIKVGDIHAR